MTVSTTTPVTSYTYTGPGDYAYVFLCYKETDLQVLFTDSDDVTTELVLSTNYTVALESDFLGGTVTLISPADTTGTLEINRVLPISQEVDWVNNDPLDMDILERAFDRTIMILQQMDVEVERAGADIAESYYQQILEALAVESVQVPWVPTVDELRLVTGSALTGLVVKGYYAPGDGGGGPVRVWKDGAAAGTYVDNGGSIIVPTGGDGSEAWVWEHSGPVNVKWFGAKGDGTTDDSAAIQAAVDIGDVFFPAATYRIASSIYITTDGRRVSGPNAVILVDDEVSGFSVGHTGSAFTKTDRVSIDNITIEGNCTSTSDPAAAIKVFSPAADPYVIDAGCSKISVSNVVASGFNMGVIATGADDIKITGCTFGGMHYVPTAQAGGYGVLLQTCFGVHIAGNRFVAAAGDRHAIYISADPTRDLDLDNVCREILVTGNTINWDEVDDITGFESGIVIRSAINCTVDGNSISGAYGGIDYSVANGSGYDLTISNNTITGVRSKGVSSRAGITTGLSATADVATNVNIAGNTISGVGDLAYGIAPAAISKLVLSDNVITITDSATGIGINCGAVDDMVIGGNNINASGYGIVFGGAADNVLLNPNQINGPAAGNKIRITTVPTNLVFGYSRRALIVTNGSGTFTVTEYDQPLSFTTAEAAAAGVKLNIQGWTDSAASNIRFDSASAAIGQVYRHGGDATSVTVGVKDFDGVELPGATNAINVVVTLLR